MVEMKRKVSNTETLDIYEKIPFIEKAPPSSENKAYIGKGKKYNIFQNICKHLDRPSEVGKDPYYFKPY